MWRLVPFVLPAVPSIVHAVHKARLCARTRPRGFAPSWLGKWVTHTTGGRLRERHQHTSEHQHESADADQQLLDAHTNYQDCDANHGNQTTNDHTSRTRGPRSTRGHDIGFVAVEVALHLIKESLLLLRQWHAAHLQLFTVTHILRVPRDSRL